MPCYKPLHGWKARRSGETGRRAIVFKRQYGYEDQPVTVPCGQCIGCKLEKSRQWAMRCMHEARLYEDNCFVTLTYDDEHLPLGGTLVKEHHQKFLKRLRARVPNRRIRFYMCGEYGELDWRPHYHYLLFNWRPDDLEIHTVNELGDRLYTSEFLQEVWPDGFSIVGECTFESAAYVARYCTKKVTGERAEEHYTRYCPITGAETRLEPEFGLMSRDGGIGKEYYQEFKDELLKHDSVIFRGKPMRPPIYYDRLHSEEELLKVKGRRAARARLTPPEENYTPRLMAKEKVKKAQAAMLKRTL